MYELMPLQDLRPGQIAHIDSLDGVADQLRRLREIGLRQGSRIEMIRPGCPCIIRLDGSKLCYRGCHRTRIMVRPTSTDVAV